MPEITIAVAYHSGYGHTARQAKAVAAGANSVDGAATALVDVEKNALGSFLGAMAQSPSDLGPQEAPPQADLDTAAHLGRRVAEQTLLLARGRQVVTR